ncbi:hypothetical protein [Ectobacillus ponti]|uniref:Uncharacterized protein n=1 Tax=Ectobacillus ponti TaxID=2961894 RepID=A0AA41XBZ6_9BACI|nr:hypothetical protein [Ectobacillus ponti]MCP8970549.1 hypothetical protein [Ectobacillus ponti]
MRFGIPYVLDTLRIELHELQEGMGNYPAWSAEYKGFESKVRQIKEALKVLEKHQLQVTEQ